MKRVLCLLVAFAMVVATTPAFAVDFSLDADAAAYLSNLEADDADNAGDRNTSLNFGEPRVDMYFWWGLTDNFSYFAEVDFYQNNSGSAFGRSADLWSSYISWNNVMGSKASLKVGDFPLQYGEVLGYVSDGAFVQENWLVGNPVVEMYASQFGVELTGPIADKFSYNVSVTNGTDRIDFSDNSDFAYMLKLDGDFSRGFGGAITYYSTDQTGANAADNLFGGQCCYEPYFLPSNAGFSAFSNTALLSGNVPAVDVTAWNIDFRWMPEQAPYAVRGFYGMYEDDSSSPTTNVGTFANDDSVPADEFQYYSIEGKYDLNPKTYVAARYSAVTNESSGVSGNDTGDRIQVGLGYWLNDYVLAKVEWVDQGIDGSVENDTTNVPHRGVGEFDGFVVELSASTY